jgi:hypothetical protein
MRGAVGPIPHDSGYHRIPSPPRNETLTLSLMAALQVSSGTTTNRAAGGVLCGRLAN